MPALYPNYPCQVCNGTHSLYFADSSTGPDIGREYVYTCTKLPCTMRVTGTDRWRPVRKKPEGAVVSGSGHSATGGANHGNH